jgi:cytochrome c biogenesis protein
VAQGFGAMKNQIDESLAKRNLKPDTLKQAEQASVSVVRSVLERAFIDTLQQQGDKKEFTDKDAKFFDDAMDAISALPAYGAPIMIQPVSFKQIQSTGLEITRAPGTLFVYIGAIMLVAGIFMLFYIHFRRQWILIKPEGSGARLLVAGSDIRKNLDFDKDFSEFCTELMTVTESKTTNDDKPTQT